MDQDTRAVLCQVLNAHKALGTIFLTIDQIRGCWFGITPSIKSLKHSLNSVVEKGYLEFNEGTYTYRGGIEADSYRSELEDVDRLSHKRKMNHNGKAHQLTRLALGTADPRNYR